MSTKTNFKRIALVAVAALGMGVLSSVPAKAAILSTVTLTTVDGIATKAKSDSLTSGASVTVDYLASAADTVVLSAVIKSMPTGAATPNLRLANGDTVGSTAAVPLATGLAGAPSGEGTQLTTTGGITVVAPSAGGRVVYNFIAHLDTAVARTTGTYTFTVVATPYSGLIQPTIQKDISIVVAALASESTVASAGTSTAYVSTTASDSSATSDSIPLVIATASSTNTPRAYVYINLKNASGAPVNESITLTTTVGNIGTSTAAGKSVVVAYSGAGSYNIYSDGTAGTATITVKSTSVTFADKTVIFYESAPSTITLSPLFTTIGVGSATNAFLATAKDSKGNAWAGSLATYSDTLGTISDTGTSCSASLVATKGYHVCNVTGVVNGTAKVKVMNATQKVVSTELSITVSNSPIASVKLSWDKATYAPGEKAYLFVDTLDSAGKPTAGANVTSLFASGGITLSSAAGNGSDSLTNTTVFTTNSMANAGLGSATDPRAIYTVYMPAAGATVKASATGGTGVLIAGQVAVSATATVTDSGAAALAAVTALATTVASLRTLITTLTNLVLKIQKKVKA